MSTKEPELTIGDRKFLIKVMRKFDIPALEVVWSRSRKKWPDIWMTKSVVPKITVTQEWARQNMTERRKRLVHELLHVKGMEHDESKGYSTIPARDTYSMKVYRILLR